MRLVTSTLVILNCLISYGQSTDSLALIQGEWEFQQMKVEGDTLIKTKNFHATKLTIENEKFTIGLSEAYASGRINNIKNRLTGTYEYGDQVFDEMSIQKVNKHKLTIKLSTSTPEYWTGVYHQKITIFLRYKK